MNIKKIKIFYFGNPYIKEDSLAIEVAEKLKKEIPDATFSYISNTFQLMDIDFENSLFLDVAGPINKVAVLDTDNIISKSASTTHDFDLGFFLKLTGRKAKIIAIPKNYSAHLAVKEAKEIIIRFQSN